MRTLAGRTPADVGAYAAAFAPGDGADVVRTAFACPGCLTLAAAIRLVDAEALPVAEAACRGCGRLWQVELDLWQVMALVLAPPHGLEVARGSQADAIALAASVTDEDVGL